jgi:hypothetical protein
LGFSAGYCWWSSSWRLSAAPALSTAAGLGRHPLLLRPSRVRPPPRKQPRLRLRPRRPQPRRRYRCRQERRCPPLQRWCHPHRRPPRPRRHRRLPQPPQRCPRCLRRRPPNARAREKLSASGRCDAGNDTGDEAHRAIVRSAACSHRVTGWRGLAERAKCFRAQDGRWEPEASRSGARQQLSAGATRRGCSKTQAESVVEQTSPWQPTSSAWQTTTQRAPMWVALQDSWLIE